MRRTGTVLALLTLAACGEVTSPGPEITASAEAPLNNRAATPRNAFSLDLDACTEVVRVEGHATVVQVIRENPSDHLLYVDGFSARGSGVGLTTGAKYRFHYKERTQQSFQNLNAEEQVADTYQEHMLLIGQGRTPNLRVLTTWHATQNARGEAVVSVTNMRTECR